MGLTELIFGITPAEIGVVTLDASIKEMHKISAKVTRHPVEIEDGGPAEISDHILVDPIALQIEGLITNTPAEFISTVATLIGGGSIDRVSDSYLNLANTVLTGQIVTIITSLAEYTDMVLESVEVSRDAQTGNALRFTANAVHLSKVSSEETAVEQRPPQQATKNSGKKNANAADAPKTATTNSFIFKMSGYKP